MELAEVRDETFAFCDLKEDYTYRYLLPQQRESCLQAALSAGRQAAGKYAGCSLEQILEDGGVKLQRFSDEPPSGIHSQICYDDHTREVDLFLPMTERISEAMAKTPYPVSPEQAEALFLAHEFYHFLEYSTGNYTDARFPTVTKTVLGVFHVQAKVRRMSEIAAFAFSRQFCASPVHPKAMDYALVNFREGKTYAELCGRMDRLQAEYEAACLAGEAGKKEGS